MLIKDGFDGWCLWGRSRALLKSGSVKCKISLVFEHEFMEYFNMKFGTLHGDFFGTSNGAYSLVTEDAREKRGRSH